MFLPNIKPCTFTGTAVLVGYLLIDDLTSAEQSALSAWLTLVADVLAANSSWLDVLQERRDAYQDMLDKIKEASDDDTDDKKDASKDDQGLDLIQSALEKMQKDIALLKKKK